MEEIASANEGSAVESNRKEPIRRHWTITRAIWAIAAGVLAGILMVTSLQAGVGFLFVEERKSWAFTLWGEHWALRAIASWIASAVAGFIAGAIARRWGAVLGFIVALPSVAIWAFLSLLAWGLVERIGPYAWDGDSISIGNRIACTVLAITTLPISALGGSIGAEATADLAGHFDSRRLSLLGVRWYHFLWLPILLNLAVIQLTVAGLYGFQWVRALFRADMTLLSVVPFVFVLAIWGTTMLTARGVGTAYEYLADLRPVPVGRSKASRVLVSAVGLPLLAAALQAAIVGIHFGVASLLRRLVN